MLIRWCVVLLAPWIFLGLNSLATAFEDPNPLRPDLDETGSVELLHLFENRIRPILIEHCYECHSAETEAAGGLLLDSRAGLRSGGDSGPAITMGDADKSLLIRAIGYLDPSLQMPPTGKLEESTIADFRNWIDQGALDPRYGESASDSVSPSGEDASVSTLDNAADHWSYQRLSTGKFPLTTEFPPGQVIDFLVDQQLIQLGLKATASATPESLVRRLYFDLIGLPPTHEQLHSAVDEVRTGQWERLVDRLLASPHFGEVMARHWMDLARYGDSITLRGFILPQAWRYRDYLIASFNEDRSFATMIREQIAGDLMHAEDWQERGRQLIATGFLALGNTNLEKQDKLQLEMDYLDEQLDVIGSVFLGQTFGCARCHDHKFDPISIKDYYAMAGILRSSTGMKHANVSEWIEKDLPLDPTQRLHFEQLESEKRKLNEQRKLLKERLDALQKPIKTVVQESLPGEVIDNEQAIKEAEKQIALIDLELKYRPKYLTVAESGKPTDLAVHIRGNAHSLGEVVPRGFLTSIQFDSVDESKIGSSRTIEMNSGATSPNRLDLANWIANKGNPLTARVYANRVWLWLMGRGLVDSPNNFGTTGQPPTHPELLDWLAGRLVHTDWSTKELMREIVMSNAYQRSVDFPDERALQIDPDNRYYGRGHLRRLTVEAMRDAMLSVSGELDTTIGGSTIPPNTPNDFNYPHQTTRRSIYHPVFRNSLPDLFEQFDFADPSVSVGKRARSTYALQSLTLSNNSWVIQRSRQAARYWNNQTAHAGVERTVVAMLISCLGREPTVDEVQLCVDTLSNSQNDQTDELAGWEALVHSMFASVDFRFLE